MENALIKKIAIVGGGVLIVVAIALIFSSNKKVENNQEETVLDENVSVEKEVINEETEKVKEETLEKENVKNDDKNFADKNNNIYFNDVKVKNADPETFSIIKHKDASGYELTSKYAKDKNNVYESYCIASPDPNYVDKDPSTTDYGEGYISDCFVEILYGADPNTFEVLNQNWAKDKNNVYFYVVTGKTKIVNEADVKTFDIVGQSDYAKDKNNVYFNEIIKNADPETFYVMNKNSDYAKDKNNCYYMGEIKDMSECDNN